jgi:hypothetical protein
VSPQMGRKSLRAIDTAFSCEPRASLRHVV